MTVLASIDELKDAIREVLLEKKDVKSNHIDELLTPEQVSEILKINKRKLLESVGIEKVYVGKFVRYRSSDVKNYIDSCHGIK